MHVILIKALITDVTSSFATSQETIGKELQPLRERPLEVAIFFYLTLYSCPVEDVEVFQIEPVFVVLQVVFEKSFDDVECLQLLFLTTSQPSYWTTTSIPSVFFISKALRLWWQQ